MFVKRFIKKLISFLIRKIFIVASRGPIPFKWLASLLILIIIRITNDQILAIINQVSGSTLKTAFWRRVSKKTFSSRYLLKILLNSGKILPNEYQAYLNSPNITSKTLMLQMHYLINQGRLDLAKIAAKAYLNGIRDDFYNENEINVLRSIGMICFLRGENNEANHYWKLAGLVRGLLFQSNIPKDYRILGASWFGAVGHVAMLDYYIKYKILNNQTHHRIVTNAKIPFGCTSLLLERFSKLGITRLLPGIKHETEIKSDYTEWAKEKNVLKWDNLTPLNKKTLIDDFWEHSFPDGEILSYTHAASRIQKEWEKTRKPPLLSISNEEKLWLANFLQRLGVPEDAWYVCVHVRESGYHQQWNAKHPQLRDSNIDDYIPAIKEITKAGGWVIRMGDPSMKTIQSLPQVVNYAHYNHRHPLADLLLAATCKFFLGTNSGFATIPVIYGIPCALSNWVPIGWPLWPTQDLMIFKLFKEKNTGRYLTLSEIFEMNLAFIQKSTDIPDNIELVDNTPEDIRLMTTEILSCFIPIKRPLSEVGAPDSIHAIYEEIAKKHNTFTGSRLASSFVKNYPEVFEMKDSIKPEGINLCDNTPAHL